MWDTFAYIGMAVTFSFAAMFVIGLFIAVAKR